MIIRSPIVFEKKALREMVHQVGNMLFGAFFNRTKRDYSAMMSDPTSSSLLMAVILWICRRWPEAPQYLEDPKGEPVYNHPMLSLLSRPNDFYGGNTMWFGAIMSLVWDGNSYLVKIRNRIGVVKQLWYVPHYMIEPMVRQSSTSFVDYYRYSPGGRAPIELDPSDVVHLRYGIDPLNLRKGFAPLKSVLRDAVTDEEADNFAASLLINMGVPGLLVSPDPQANGSPQDADVDSVKKQIEEKTRGDNRGRALVVKGPWKIQQFGFDPKSMDLAALRGIPEERVSAITGIPAAVVGFGSGLAQTKVGATMAEMRQMAYEDGIIPLQRMVNDELKAQILDDFEPNPENWKVKHDLSEVRVLQEDQDKLHTRTTSDFNGGLISYQEGRQALGYEDDGTPDFRRVPITASEIPIGETQQPAVPTPQAQPKSIGAYKYLDEHDCSEHGQIDIKAWKPAKRSKTVQAMVDLANRVHSSMSAKYAPQLDAGFVRIADRVVTAFDTVESLLDLSAIKSLKADQPTPTPQDVATIELSAHRVLTQASQAGGLSEELAWQTQYISVTETMFEGMKGIFGTAINISDPPMREVIAKGGRHFALVGLDEQTQQAVFDGILEGRVAGKGPREIARMIRSNVEGKTMFPGIWNDKYNYWIGRGRSTENAAKMADNAARQYRAEVIARTETKYAQNVATLEVSKQSGTFNAMQIVDGQYGPPRSCEICLARDGETVTFDRADTLASEEHPQGTMSFSPIVQEAS